MAGAVAISSGSPCGAEDAVFGFEALGAAHGVMEIDLRAQDGEQASVVPGLLNKVLRTAAHGFDGDFDVGPRGHDDDRHLGIVSFDLGEQIEAFLARGGVARVVEVDEQRVVGAGFEGLQHHEGGARLFDAKAFGFEQELERVEDVGLVVSDEKRRLAAGLGGVGQDRPLRSNSRPAVQAKALLAVLMAD